MKRLRSEFPDIEILPIARKTMEDMPLKMRVYFGPEQVAREASAIATLLKAGAALSKDDAKVASQYNSADIVVVVPKGAK